MDASYSWHPGAHGINPVWAIPVSILPDEIFSSWLVRAALIQGCDPFVLTENLWPKWRIWTVDLDRILSGKRMIPLSESSGITTTAFNMAMLEPYAKKLCSGNLPINNIWPWILALGIRNTKRRSGIQFCAKCLADSPVPYYCIQWRYAWHTTCEKHKCLLIDRCKNCTAPIEPHRLIAYDQHMAICASCKTDMRNHSVEAAHSDALMFQNFADDVLRRGEGTLLGTGLETSDWFLLIRFFVSLIRRANRSTENKLKKAVEGLGVNFTQIELEEFGLELLNVHDRHFLFSLVYHFLETDFDHLKRILLNSGVSQEGLLTKNSTIPSVMMDIMSGLPSKSIVHTVKNMRMKDTPRPAYEVARMMRRLQRKLEMSER